MSELVRLVGKLDEHGEHKQNGEGLCDVAIIDLILKLRGISGWSREKLRATLGTTVKYGTEMRDVFYFWNEIGVGAYHEADCDFDRLKTMVAAGKVCDWQVVANVWDGRTEPDMDPKDDPDEDHSVVILDVVGATEKDAKVVYFDPRTNDLFHGIREMSWNEWREWWHSNPAKSAYGNDYEVNYENGSMAWLMVVGATKNQVCDVIGRPEGPRLLGEGIARLQITTLPVSLSLQEDP